MIATFLLLLTGQGELTPLPDDFRDAAELMFAHGLADPRGAELRRAVVKGQRDWQTRKPKESFGWVHPERPDRLICVDGMSYPIERLGEKVDYEQARRESPGMWRVPWLPADQMFHSMRQIDIDDSLTFAAVRARAGVTVSGLGRTDSGRDHTSALRQLSRSFLERLYLVTTYWFQAEELPEVLRLTALFEEHKDFHREAANLHPGSPDEYGRLPDPLDRYQLMGLMRTDAHRRLTRPYEPPVDLAEIRQLPQDEEVRLLIRSLDSLGPYSHTGTANPPPKLNLAVMRLTEIGEPAVGALTMAIISDRRLVVDRRQVVNPSRSIITVGDICEQIVWQIVSKLATGERLNFDRQLLIDSWQSRL